MRTIELGEMFLFRPPDATDADYGPDRLHVVLSPRSGGYRSLTMGPKRLPPNRQSGRRRWWGRVEHVSRDLDSVRRHVGSTPPPPPGGTDAPTSEQLGRGIYRLVRHRDHTHIAYQLRREDASVSLHREESYILAVRNPDVALPDDEREPCCRYPAALRAHFRGRPFSEADPVELLNHEGAEVVLIAAPRDVSEQLGIELDPHEEAARLADVFEALDLDCRHTPVRPRF